MDQTLIDQIYECSLSPEFWPSVLDELANLADARGGHLVTATTEVLNWTSSASLLGSMEKLTAADFVRRGQRCTRLLASRHAGFLTENDIYADGEMAADPFYRDLLWPSGLGWATGTAVPLPTGDTLFITVERDKHRGPVEPTIVQQLDALRPHLARSGLLSARLHLERARVAGETLALIGLPALVLDEKARVLAANHLIEDMTGHILWRAYDRFTLQDPIAQDLFRRNIETLDQENGGAVRSLVLRDVDNSAAMVAHVIPIRRSARDIFERCAAMLVLTPVTLPQAPAVELVQSLFDLTPAEARVARHLAEGQTVSEIASRDGISGNTVRTQVRAVLQKTGCRDPTEVVALLGGLAPQKA